MRRKKQPWKKVLISGCFLVILRGAIDLEKEVNLRSCRKLGDVVAELVAAQTNGRELKSYRTHVVSGGIQNNYAELHLTHVSS